MLLSYNHGGCVHVIENYFASSSWAIFFSTRDSYAFLTCEGISKKYIIIIAEEHHESFPVFKNGKGRKDALQYSASSG